MTPCRLEPGYTDNPVSKLPPRVKRALAMTKSAHIDFFVGAQIRKARLNRDLTQEVLADRIGVSYQQLQKYESGFNRVGASRLWQIATALELSISYFFPDGDGL
jgi:DNA-binding transcriptional regulator YiaG